MLDSFLCQAKLIIPVSLPVDIVSSALDPTNIRPLSQAISSCSDEYHSWSSSSISFFDNEYVSFKARGKIRDPAWPPKFTVPRPSCCEPLTEPAATALRAAQISAEQGGRISEITSTAHHHNVTIPASWISCDKARSTTGSAWTWVDGYPRVNVTVDPKQCDGPSLITNEYLLSSVSTIYPNFTDLMGVTELPCIGPLLMEVDDRNCAILDQGRVEVIYWPVSLESSGSSTYTITPTETGLVTAEWRGKTFTSPTVYLLYSTLWAGGWDVPILKSYLKHINDNRPPATAETGIEDPTNDPFAPDWSTALRIGSSYTDVLIPIPTDIELSTFHYSRVGTSVVKAFTQAFNYADLSPNPLPASKWLLDCGFDDLGKPFDDREAMCATINQKASPYRYRIVPPLNLVRDIDPAWQNCTMIDNTGFYGLYATWDPPVALEPKPPLVEAVTTTQEPIPMTSPSPATRTWTIVDPTPSPNPTPPTPMADLDKGKAKSDSKPDANSKADPGPSNNQASHSEKSNGGGKGNGKAKGDDSPPGSSDHHSKTGKHKSKHIGNGHKTKDNDGSPGLPEGPAASLPTETPSNPLGDAIMYPFTHIAGGSTSVIPVQTQAPSINDPNNGFLGNTTTRTDTIIVAAGMGNKRFARMGQVLGIWCILQLLLL